MPLILFCMALRFNLRIALREILSGCHGQRHRYPSSPQFTLRVPWARKALCWADPGRSGHKCHNCTTVIKAEDRKEVLRQNKRSLKQIPYTTLQ
ncbi:hypothetical protein L596_022669 [Steinernema carpocapsae]|uniref:Secreted protein n=1 Tax=Steinernema carpocapsae TaxID=34508 RepID=A0A4V6A0G2_STECR|nr:hypothetical protein L596_022669 [Steinernema carpocapsae]